MTGSSTHDLCLKMDGETPVLAWSANHEDRREVHDGEQKLAFAHFPNISSPAELMQTYRQLAQPPVPPMHGAFNLTEITDPLGLLELFGVTPTRTHTQEAKGALESNLVNADSYSVIPVEDCVAMSRDMRGLLTILLFSYGLCDMHALELNTETEFAFLHEWEDGVSPYGNFIRMAREDDPHVLELDQGFMKQDIDQALRSRNGKPTRKLLRSLQRFAEEYITSLMYSVHPLLKDRQLAFKSNAGTLGHIYAYWAELACKGRAIACSYCGNLVANARKGRMYCSDSCKVQASKNGMNR